MALNLNLASAIVQLQLDRSAFDPALAQVIARLNSLRGLGTVRLSMDRSQATASLNLVRQQIDALKKDAEINLTVRQGGGGGRGGFGLGQGSGGALGQGAMGLAQGLGVAGMAFSPAMAAGQMLGSGLRDAVGTAMELQSTFIGLRRYTGESAANIEKFKETIFSISKSQAGVSVKDLTDIASAGAKAGITDREGMGGLETFVRGMAKVRNSVEGMSTETLSNDMVRMLNLFGKGTDYVESFGSVLARMDNVSTSSAADILDISKALSGTFASLNLTIPQVMAFSSVLSDVGLTNQQGASSFSQILRMLASQSEMFANAIGMPVEKFQAAVKGNALGALKLLIDKFKEINEVNPIKAQEFISGLGFRGVKTAGALQQLASMIEKVSERTAMANEEERTHGSLLSANAMNSEKAASATLKFKNAMTDLAEVMGRTFLPGIAKAAETLTAVTAVVGNKGGKAEEAHARALQAAFGGASKEDSEQLRAESTSVYQKLFGDDQEIKNKELMKAAAEREKKSAPAQVRAEQLAAIEADNARRRDAAADAASPLGKAREMAEAEVGPARKDAKGKVSEADQEEHDKAVTQHERRLKVEQDAATVDRMRDRMAEERRIAADMARVRRPGTPGADAESAGDVAGRRSGIDRNAMIDAARTPEEVDAVMNDAATKLGEKIKFRGMQALATIFAPGEAKAGMVADLVAGAAQAGAAKLPKGAKGAIDAAAEDLENPRKPFQSQSFGDPADFARNAIQTALSDKDDKQLAEQKQANGHLKDIKDEIRKGGGDKTRRRGTVLSGRA